MWTFECDRYSKGPHGMRDPNRGVAPREIGRLCFQSVDLFIKLRAHRRRQTMIRCGECIAQILQVLPIAFRDAPRSGQIGSGDSRRKSEIEREHENPNQHDAYRQEDCAPFKKFLHHGVLTIDLTTWMSHRVCKTVPACAVAVTPV